MVSLFPYISSDLLSQALNHPTYGGSPQPLVEAILAGGFNLPSELRELRAIVMDHSGLGDQAEGSGTTNGNSNVKKVERRNIWQDEKIDFSRLKIKDHSYVHYNLAFLVNGMTDSQRRSDCHTRRSRYPKSPARLNLQISREPSYRS
jgi:hypothetical protein